jgi:hypothetical protein
MSAGARKGGKGSRAKRKAQRQAQRRAKKAAYAALAGRPNSRKRAGSGRGSRKVPGHPHLHACGNGACPREGLTTANDPWQAAPGSCLYGKRWSSRKWRTA